MILTMENKIDPQSVFCTACEETESTESNEIFLCDLCATPVHQICYGDELLEFTDKSRNWFCQRCLLLLSTPRIKPFSCILCPETNMILKQVNLSYEGKGNLSWVHLSCLKRLPKVESEKVFEARVDFSMSTHNCHVCDGKQGYTQQCAYVACQRWYHIGCAKVQGLILQGESMQILRILMKTRSKQDSDLNFYCLEHIESNINRLKEEQEDHARLVIENTTAIRDYRIECWYSLNQKQASRYKPKPTKRLKQSHSQSAERIPEAKPKSPENEALYMPLDIEKIINEGIQSVFMSLFSGCVSSYQYDQLKELVEQQSLQQLMESPSFYRIILEAINRAQQSKPPDLQEDDDKSNQIVEEQQANNTYDPLMELVQRKKQPKKPVTKAKLIRSYAKNLTDNDILENIQNFSIRESELDLVIPKKFRYLRGEYEKAIKENVNQKLLILRQEFFQLNINEEMSAKELYIQVDIEVCGYLFEEYVDVYNLPELQKYIWGYFCLNGLLDQKCEKMNLTLKNPISSFWYKIAKSMKVPVDMGVLEFILSLQQKYMKILNRSNELRLQQQQLENLQGEQIIIIE